jgi:RHS repeat-associated protein
VVQSYTRFNPAGGGATAYIIHDQQGTPLGVHINGNVYAYVTDNLGSVVNLINVSGATSASYSYDPYGKTLSSTGGTANNDLPGYTGALTDSVFDASTGIPGTGYIHFGQRWYNPPISRFTTQDTNAYLNDLSNGNRYAYAGDDPANYTDPTGRLTCGDFVGGVFLAVSILGGIVFGGIGGVIFAGVVGLVGLWDTDVVCG